MGLIVVLLYVYMFHEGNMQFYYTPPLRNRFSYVPTSSERYRLSAKGNTVDDIHNLRRLNDFWSPLVPPVADAGSHGHRWREIATKIADVTNNKVNSNMRAP